MIVWFVELLSILCISRMIILAWLKLESDYKELEAIENEKLGPPPEVLRVEEPEFDSLLNLSKPVVPLPIVGAVSRVTPACTLILRWLCPVVLYSFLLGTMLVNLKPLT